MRVQCEIRGKCCLRCLVWFLTTIVEITASQGLVDSQGNTGSTTLAGPAPDYLLRITRGRRLFSRDGEEYIKICSTPQNGSRGGDTFSLCRGGVEGGKGGDKPNFYRRKHGFLRNKSKKQEAFFNKIRVQSFRARITKERDFFPKKCTFPLFWPEIFLKVPDFRL